MIAGAGYGTAFAATVASPVLACALVPVRVERPSARAEARDQPDHRPCTGERLTGTRSSEAPRCCSPENSSRSRSLRVVTAKVPLTWDEVALLIGHLTRGGLGHQKGYPGARTSPSRAEQSDTDSLILL